jgi:class 3 adenylate cyclase
MSSLRQRLILFLIIPVAVILFLTGLIGFIYAKNTMLGEWQEAAILKLQRAAHQIDMRLTSPKEWMDMFHRTGTGRGEPAIQDWILDQLKSVDGVVDVRLEWSKSAPEIMKMPLRGSHMGRKGLMRFRRAKISEVTVPRYDAESGLETVTLISDLKDESGETIGRLKVSLSFDYLMQDIIRLGWWESELACLVDEEGQYLAHSKAMIGRQRLGETKDPVELAILDKMKRASFGTHLGPGHPPSLVSGFYSIKEAPWTIVMFAPGEKVLSPIVRFRLYYALAGSLCIVFILLLIHSIGGRLVQAIGKISNAANQVAKGNYGDPLPEKSKDEIGQLVRSFNTMVKGLKERDFISNTFGRYVDQEIAKELMKRPEAIRLGGEKREVVILMSDIRGFTAVSEALKPEGIISILNHYFSHMIEVIKRYQGIIVDFFGDGVLVFFDPLDGPVAHTAHRALRCALEMQNEMKEFNSEMREENLPELQMGIGLNSGDVVVGNIGSEARAKYGIVGSPVNITQRIQATAKEGEVVISASIYSHLSNDIIIGKSFSIQLKGVQEPTTLSVVEGFREKKTQHT